MKSQCVARALIIISVVMGAVVVGGCGGDAGCCGFGGARGYVYQSDTGSVIVSASPNPPAGYAPVPAGTVVRIDGFPELEVTTNQNGFYYLPAIPAGSRVLVVEAPGGRVTLSIPIIANRITEGGGHTEGGGGS